MTEGIAATANQIVMGPFFWIATSIFILAYALIIWDKIHKTILALFGATLLIVIGIITQEEAFTSMDIGIDWNVIFLLISMMVIINIMKPTGCFEYLAIKSAKLAKGKPFMIMAIFSVVTAVVSAFLDNVTTVLLIAPVTLLICQALELDIVPFLITEAIASNIGGTATLIGDPPNIISPSITLNIETSPDNGDKLSCMQFTAPQEASVVITEYSTLLATPNRVSLPSIFPAMFKTLL